MVLSNFQLQERFQKKKFTMALTRISVTLLLLVGIMTVVTFAENQDRESEEDNEYGDVQDGKRYCHVNYLRCVHRYRKCRKVCLYFRYYCLRIHGGVRDAERSIEGSLTPLDQPMAFASLNVDMPAKFEEENENGYVQLKYRLSACYSLYGYCSCKFGKRCKKACLFYFRKCIADDKVNLVQ